jgi:aquaporin Z
MPPLEDLAYHRALGKAGFDVSVGFASNGYSEHSSGGYSLAACLLADIVLTFMFLLIIMDSTDKRAPKGFAPIAIGLGLTLIHLIGIPVTNLSVNPARSTGPALFAGGWALEELRAFWVAPIIGAILAGVVYRAMFEDVEHREPEAHGAAASVPPSSWIPSALDRKRSRPRYQARSYHP